MARNKIETLFDEEIGRLEARSELLRHMSDLHKRVTYLESRLNLMENRLSSMGYKSTSIQGDKAIPHPFGPRENR